MARVVVSDNAKRDIRWILSDLAERAGYRVAARYAEDFKAMCRRLSNFPDSGPPRPELGTRARIAIVRPYIVIYDHTDDATVTVLRVLHGKRNITRDLIR
jgi:plasmid stabilization system protein ParE